MSAGLVWLKYAKDGILTAWMTRLLFVERFFLSFEPSNQGRSIENGRNWVQANLLGAFVA